ncbi:hypothetical protein SynSYN20_00362 [Synechococcus sp. SYN20]|nr:hypothetical protein SynMVIR181_00335 [Synechococcus sp. MVIR-18-1]QNJ24720.1 hypothetical protein SynSYN20_00362 [Synechococcus sp. SYN20]
MSIVRAALAARSIPRFADVTMLFMSVSLDRLPLQNGAGLS